MRTQWEDGYRWILINSLEREKGEDEGRQEKKGGSSSDEASISNRIEYTVTNERIIEFR